MSYHNGTLNISRKFDGEFSAGFNVSMFFTDGHGIAVAPSTGESHQVHGSTTLGHDKLEITNDFAWTSK